LAAAGSVGEALREIDRLRLVKSDFVLVRGGVLSNLPLPSIVEQHRKMREENPDKMLMTMVTMQTENHSAFDSKRYIYAFLANGRDLREARLHVLDEENSTLSSQYDFHQCLLSEHVPVYPERKRVVQLSKDVTRHHTNVVFRNDLYDCNIDICTPEVFHSDYNLRIGPCIIYRKL
jgi:translation initiation factor eIF-2B subunit epsilon